MPKDPFDFNDTSDLPEDIQKAMGKTSRFGNIEEKTANLICEFGKSVNAAELRAAFYRTHKIELNRTQASNALQHLRQKGVLTRVSVGRYAFVKTSS